MRKSNYVFCTAAAVVNEEAMEEADFLKNKNLNDRMSDLMIQQCRDYDRFEINEKAYRRRNSRSYYRKRKYAIYNKSVQKGIGGMFEKFSCVGKAMCNEYDVDKRCERKMNKEDKERYFRRCNNKKSEKFPKQNYEAENKICVNTRTFENREAVIDKSNIVYIDRMKPEKKAESAENNYYNYYDSYKSNINENNTADITATGKQNNFKAAFEKEFYEKKFANERHLKEKSGKILTCLEANRDRINNSGKLYIKDENRIKNCGIARKNEKQEEQNLHVTNYCATNNKRNIPPRKVKKEDSEVKEIYFYGENCKENRRENKIKSNSSEGSKNNNENNYNNCKIKSYNLKNSHVNFEEKSRVEFFFKEADSNKKHLKSRSYNENKSDFRTNKSSIVNAREAKDNIQDVFFLTEIDNKEVLKNKENYDHNYCHSYSCFASSCPSPQRALLENENKEQLLKNNNFECLKSSMNEDENTCFSENVFLTSALSCSSFYTERAICLKNPQSSVACFDENLKQGNSNLERTRSNATDGKNRQDDSAYRLIMKAENKKENSLNNLCVSSLLSNTAILSSELQNVKDVSFSKSSNNLFFSNDSSAFPHNFYAQKSFMSNNNDKNNKDLTLSSSASFSSSLPTSENKSSSFSFVENISSFTCPYSPTDLLIHKSQETLNSNYDHCSSSKIDCFYKKTYNDNNIFTTISSQDSISLISSSFSPATSSFSSGTSSFSSATSSTSSSSSISFSAFPSVFSSCSSCSSFDNENSTLNPGFSDISLSTIEMKEKLQKDMEEKIEDHSIMSSCIKDKLIFAIRRIAALETENEILVRNMSCLFKTAKEEIARKDEKILKKKKKIKDLKANIRENVFPCKCVK